MSALKTFALIHPLTADQLLRFRNAFPAIEILHADFGVPAGFGRAQGAAMHWTFKDVDSLLAVGKSLKWLHLRSTGVDHLTDSIRRRDDLTLTNGSGNHAPNIAEHVMALMLAFARQIPHFVRAQDRRSWDPVVSRQVFELSGQHMVIVGLGSIGLEVARRAKAMGMRVTGIRRSVPTQLPLSVDQVVEIANTDRILGEADHVVLALPLTTESENLFDQKRMACMKRGAYLYNVGRGPVVNHDALIRALNSGQVAGAGLDVTHPEPLPEESELWGMPNVLLTAHTSGATPRSYDRFEELLMENIRRFAEGRPLLNVVDKKAGY